MFKNVASQKLTVYVFDATTNLPKTGDAANLTAYRSLDDGAITVLGDTSATELDATNAKGFYIFDLTQGETNGDKNLYTCKSGTANMVCLAMPAVVYTLPPNFTATSIDSSGRVDVVKVGGTTQTAGDIYARIGAPAGASIAADIAAIRVDTNTTIPNLIAALNNISSANVKTQVVAALNTDTYAEPGQATPAATTTLVLKIGYLFKAWRNKSTQTASAYNLFNDDAATVDQKATFADDGTTAPIGEVTTGP